MHTTGLIREATESDISDIVRINNHWVEKGDLKLKLELSSLAERMIEYENYFVYEIEDKVVGYVSIVPNPQKEDSEWFLARVNDYDPKTALIIHQIAIEKGLQKRGIGHLLYSFIFERYPNRMIYVAIEQSNNDSLEFHRKQGFTFVTNIEDNRGIYRKDST